MTILGYIPIGFEGITVSVEVDIRRGIPGTEIVGMAGPPVREARERVRVALKNSGYHYPQDRILVNLSPADLPKVGAGFDLAIALAVLAASGQLHVSGVSRLLAVGELGLDGSLRRVPGVVAAASAALAANVDRIVVPEVNRQEASCVVGDRLVAGRSLKDIVGTALRRGHAPTRERSPAAGQPGPSTVAPTLSYRQLTENPRGLRALIIAAAGRHHLLLSGPPGSGKTVLARSLPALLPELGPNEALEVSRIHSLAGSLSPDSSLVTVPPFRAPHHTASVEGVIGGGSKLTPGEISLAHCGALFLDEALEFRKNVLQGLREPLERRRVYLARAGRTFWYPADFQLVLACNACSCGNLGKAGSRCSCSFEEVSRYWRRLGGPLLDRIPIRVPFGTPEKEEFTLPKDLSAARQCVWKARRAGTARGNNPGRGPLSPECARILAAGTKRFGLSRRGESATVAVARTIADLDGSEEIVEDHLFEALGHRSFLEGPEAHPAFVW